MKRKISWINWIFGFLFGAAISFGYQLQNDMFVDLKSKWTYISILVIGLSAGILTRLFWRTIKIWALRKACGGQGYIERPAYAGSAKNEKSLKGPLRILESEKFLWFKYSALIWLCHFTAFLGVYPGFFVYDANEELMETVNGVFTAHHPLIHVLSMGKVILGIEKASGDINLGIAAFILLGMTIAALTYGYLVYRLRKMGINRIWGVAVSLYFGLFPVLVMYSLCSSKDGVFGCFLILSVIFIKDMVAEPEEFFNSLKGPAFLTASLTMMMLFRNNGVYALAAFAILYLLVSAGSLFGKMHIPEQTDISANAADEKQEMPAEAGENLGPAAAAGENRVREGRYILWSLGIMAVAVALYVIVNGAMIKAVDAQTGEKKEMLSVPIMQLARTYVYELDDPQAPSQENASEEIIKDKAAIERYISVDSLAHYSYKISDMVKCGFNEEEYAADPAGFWRIWWKYAKKSPVTYLNAALGTSFGIWYPWAVIDAYKGNTMYTYTYGDSSYFGYEVEEPGWRDSKIPAIDEFYRWLSLDIDIQKMPVVHLLFSPGFMLWLYLFFMGYLIYGSSEEVQGAKDSGFRLLTSKRVVPYLLPLMVIMTCLLGPVSLVRYSFFLWALLPYVIVDIKKR